MARLSLATAAGPTSGGGSMDRVQSHSMGDLHAGFCLRYLRGHDHAIGDPDRMARPSTGSASCRRCWFCGCASASKRARGYLSIWMFCAIFAYYLCGWLSDLFGRRYVIPAFCLPAAVLLIVMGQFDSASSLFWVGLILNFLITGSDGSGLGYNTELFPTQIRGTAVGAAFTFGSAGGALAPAIVGWVATSHSIATARKLAILIWHLLTKNENYLWSRPALHARKLRDLELKAGHKSARGQKGTAHAYNLKSQRDQERRWVEQGETAYAGFVAGWNARGPKARTGAAKEERQ
jgi:hypothetical protein